MHKQVTELLFQPELCIKSFWIFDFGGWRRCLKSEVLARILTCLVLHPALHVIMKLVVGTELSDDGWLFYVWYSLIHVYCLEILPSFLCTRCYSPPRQGQVLTCYDSAVKALVAFVCSTCCHWRV